MTGEEAERRWMRSLCPEAQSIIFRSQYYRFLGEAGPTMAEREAAQWAQAAFDAKQRIDDAPWVEAAERGVMP